MMETSMMETTMIGSESVESEKTNQHLTTDKSEFDGLRKRILSSNLKNDSFSRLWSSSFSDSDEATPLPTVFPDSKMKRLLGFDHKDLKSVKSFVGLLQTAKDSSCLGIFRILFGKL